MAHIQSSLQAYKVVEWAHPFAHVPYTFVRSQKDDKKEFVGRGCGPQPGKILVLFRSGARYLTSSLCIQLLGKHICCTTEMYHRLTYVFGPNQRQNASLSCNFVCSVARLQIF